jgi:hypothetical protein
MPYRVNVELKDGAVCQMAKKAFNVFLSLDKVARFERSNGWIDVKKDSMRGTRTGRAITLSLLIVEVLVKVLGLSSGRHGMILATFMTCGYYFFSN